MGADFTANTLNYPAAQMVECTRQLLSQGMDYAQGHEFERAIACFTQSIQVITTTLQQRQQTQQAISALDLATVDINLAQSYYHRGCALCKLDSYSDAIADFTRLLQQAPLHAPSADWVRTKHAEIYIHRGNAYRLLGSYSRALSDLNQGIEHSKGSAQSYSCRGPASARPRGF